MKKIYRAQDAAHVEKTFIEEYQDIPPGWHRSVADALAAWSEPTPEPKKRGPGRPRKTEVET